MKSLIQETRVNAMTENKMILAERVVFQQMNPLQSLVSKEEHFFFAAQEARRTVGHASHRRLFNAAPFAVEPVVL
jgi:hypothetical protein